jgi:hypothetical protein
MCAPRIYNLQNHPIDYCDVIDRAEMYQTSRPKAKKLKGQKAKNISWTQINTDFHRLRSSIYHESSKWPEGSATKVDSSMQA